MISEQTALQTPTASLVADIWRRPGRHPVRQYLAPIGRSLVSLSRGLQALTRVPALPYAAIWEASVVVDMVSGQGSHDRDPSRNDASDLSHVASGGVHVPGADTGYASDSGMCGLTRTSRRTPA
jgi:hypothetical protein